MSKHFKDKEVSYTETDIRFVDILSANDKPSRKIYWKALKYSINHNIQENFFKYWSLCLQRIDSISQLKSFIKECNNLAEKKGYTNIVYNWMDKFLSEETYHSHPQTIEEMKLMYGLYLFDMEKMVQKSYSILSDHFEKDSQDSRTWIPLYFLCHRLGEKKTFYLNYLILSFLF